MAGNKLETTPIHLGLGARAHVEPAFTGMAWYADYGARHVADGAEGRLVSMHTFSESWTGWEMHPACDGVVLCTAGEMVLHQQARDGTVTTVRIGAGEYAINPPGVWHTADIVGEATVVFITAGMGTENRAR